MILHLFCASLSQYFGLEFLARDDVFKSFKGKSTMSRCEDFFLKQILLLLNFFYGQIELFRPEVAMMFFQYVISFTHLVFECNTGEKLEK